MNSASCRATQRTTCSRATAVGPLLPPVVPHVVAKLEEWLGAEIEEAHLLVGQNQRLAATHVAVVQEVSALRHKLGRTARGLAAAQEEGDLRLCEVHDSACRTILETDGPCRANLVVILQKITHCDK